MDKVTPAAMVSRWRSANRPLFKGELISVDGCKCAQGDVLHVCGVTDEQLGTMSQWTADVKCAKLLGISRFHSVLLRTVNDCLEGCPQEALTATGLRKILGPNWRATLAFARYVEALSVPEQEDVVYKWRTLFESPGSRNPPIGRARKASASVLGEIKATALRAVWRDNMRSDSMDFHLACLSASDEIAGWSQLSHPTFLRFFFEDPAAWIKEHEADVDPGVVEDVETGQGAAAGA